MLERDSGCWSAIPGVGARSRVLERDSGCWSAIPGVGARFRVLKRDSECWKCVSESWERVFVTFETFCGLCVPVRALMRRVSDFAHFLPDTQACSNVGLLKIEKNTKKRRKKMRAPALQEEKYYTLYYITVSVM